MAAYVKKAAKATNIENQLWQAVGVWIYPIFKPLKW